MISRERIMCLLIAFSLPLFSFSEENYYPSNLELRVKEHLDMINRHVLVSEEKILQIKNDINNPEKIMESLEMLSMYLYMIKYPFDWNNILKN